jgi:hypothetical protein
MSEICTTLKICGFSGCLPQNGELLEFVSYPTGSRLESVGEPRQEIYERVLPFLPTQG